MGVCYDGVEGVLYLCLFSTLAACAFTVMLCAIPRAWRQIACRSVRSLPACLSVLISSPLCSFTHCMNQPVHVLYMLIYECKFICASSRWQLINLCLLCAFKHQCSSIQQTIRLILHVLTPSNTFIYITDAYYTFRWISCPSGFHCF